MAVGTTAMSSHAHLHGASALWQLLSLESVPSEMRAERVIRYIAIVGAVGLVVVILLAVGFESEDQVDPARMRGRSVAKLFDHTVFVGREAPLDFALRFPVAVEGRPTGGWHAMRLWSFLGSPRFTSRTKRLVHDAQSFVGLPETLGMPDSDADRIAKRILDLVVKQTEFSIEIDDDFSLHLKSEGGVVVETWSPAAP